MSSFTPNIPASGQSLLVTRDPIKNNFSTINTTISQDHVAMNDANQGKHNFSTYVDQGVTAPTTTASEYAVYATEINSAIELSARAQSSGAIYQLSGPIGDTATATAGGCSVGVSFQLRWGTYTSNPTTLVVQFRDGAGNLNPFPNNCFCVQTQGTNTNLGATVNTLTVNGFTHSSAQSTQTWTYLAIGN